MSRVLEARHLPADAPVTGYELRSARRAIPPAAHERVHRCSCGAWAWQGKPCQTCAALEVARAQPVHGPVDGPR